MAGPEDVRQTILNTIEKNPGLHFREIQRRTYTATGQLEYHLYQLEKENRIIKREDGKLKRFFSNEQGTTFERTLLYHMRNRESARIISTLLQGEKHLNDLSGRSITKREAISERVKQLEHDEILQSFDSDSGIVLRVLEKEKIIAILKKFRESFLDSMAMNLLSLLE